QRFYEANEFLYYFAFEFFRDMSFGAQAIFVFSAVINAFLTVLILFRLKDLSFNLTIFAFVFFCVSGIYHNQMNGLRQFTAVLSVILCSLYLHSSSFKTMLSAFLASLSHTSSLLVLPTLLVSKLNITKRKLIFIFVFSFPLYFFLLPLFFDYLLSLIGGVYIKYVEFERDVGLLASLTKLYYVPFFVLF
ncbi:EpsG family protein, partial [Vibrio mimicus]